MLPLLQPPSFASALPTCSLTSADPLTCLQVAQEEEEAAAAAEALEDPEARAAALEAQRVSPGCWLRMCGRLLATEQGERETKRWRCS